MPDAAPTVEGSRGCLGRKSDVPRTTDNFRHARDLKRKRQEGRSQHVIRRTLGGNANRSGIGMGWNGAVMRGDSRREAGTLRVK